MSPEIQLLIGFVPLIFVALIFIIRRKLIIAPILMTVCIGAVVTVAFLLPETEEKDNVAGISSYDEMIYMAGAYINDGNYDKAEEVLDEIYAQYGDSAKGTLYKARIRFLKEDYEGALVLYEKAKEINDDDFGINASEDELFASIKEEKLVDSSTAAKQEAMLEYLDKNNLDSDDYGYNDKVSYSQAKKDYEEASKIILDCIDEDAKEIESDNEKLYENIMKAIGHANNIEKIYAEYLINGSFDEEALEEEYDDLKDIYEETPEVNSIDTIDEAYVRAVTLLKKYKQLEEYANHTNSQLAITTLAGLYVNDTIAEDDFSDDFVAATENQYEKVSNQCEKALDKVKDKTEDINVISKCEAMVGTIAFRKEDKILAELDTRMKPDEAPLSDQSKMFLQSSNISSNLGDEEKAKESFKEAIDKSVYSDDEKYTNAMEKIIAIVNETADSQELANSKNYVDEAYKNSFPVKPNEEIKESIELENNATTYITTQLAMINIGKVDISNFPDIKADVQFGKPLDLDKLNISVTDAGAAIKDFTLEKNSFDKAKIYLTCDISGSMNENEAALKESVKKFVDSMTSKEEVAIIGFNSGVSFDSGFLDKNDNFEEYIDKLNTYGGTNIGSAAYASIDAFKDAKDSFNIIVLMTDGNDSSFNSRESLVDLRKRCEENNVILFTIGLGASVNVEYLKNIAEYGNGSYMQSNDAASLDSLYSFIHRQMENNYTLKFKALDEITNNRLLTITNNDDNSTGKRKYMLNYDIDTDDEIDEGIFVDVSGDAFIDGIDTPVIYKSENVIPVINLLGENLKKAEAITVTLSGTANYNTTAKVSDDNHVTVTLPDDIMLGRYSVNITLDGYRSTLENALEVLDGKNRKTITFGAYTFVASKISQGDGKTTLSGNVIMNDFLRFKGDVVIDGDLESGKVKLIDENGSYINFTKELPGLLGVMFANTMNIPAIGQLDIYNDKANVSNLDEYNVEKWSLPAPVSFACMVYESPSMALYPHKIDLTVGKINTDLPFMNEIFKYNGEDEPFLVEGEASGVITSETVGIVGVFKASAGDMVKLSIIPVKLNDVELKFDTLKNDYYFKLIIGTDKIFKFQKNQEETGYGFDLGFKDGRWDQLALYADIPITVCATPPVSISDFMVGVEGLSGENQDAGFKDRLSGATYKGALDVSFCKLSDLIPALDAIFGDVALATLDDTTLSVRFKDFAMNAKTTLKLFGYIEMGESDLKLGKYDYENHLLGISKTSTGGISISNTLGLKLDISNIDITSQGTSTITVNDVFTGVWNKGVIKYDINFLGKHSASCDGDLLMGIHNNATQFSMVIKGADVKNNKEVGVKLTFGGNRFADVKLY